MVDFIINVIIVTLHLFRGFGMNTIKHGLSIGIQRVENTFFLSLKAVGTLTHADYEMITPIIDSSLKSIKNPRVKAFIDITEFEGWELKAAWDDFKIGLQHGNEFVKIAIYGNKNWQEIAAKISSWFVTGEIKSFKDEAEALSWLQTD